jgi:hypothetical protein
MVLLKYVVNSTPFNMGYRKAKEERALQESRR